MSIYLNWSQCITYYCYTLVMHSKLSLSFCTNSGPWLLKQDSTSIPLFLSNLNFHLFIYFSSHQPPASFRQGRPLPGRHGRFLRPCQLLAQLCVQWPQCVRVGREGGGRRRQGARRPLPRRLHLGPRGERTDTRCLFCLLFFLRISPNATW